MNQLNHASGNMVADKRADYARLCAADGDYLVAADVMLQALELAPNWAVGWFQLGGYFERGDEKESAVAAYKQALQQGPLDYLGAALKIAFLEKTHSESAATAYAEALFDDYADKFDAALVEKLGYQVPSLLSKLLFENAGSDKFAQSIDLGCGTGLMAAEVRHSVGHLVGIDISEKMLKKADAKGLYDELIKSDLVTGLSALQRINLIMAADVFMYMPDLKNTFSAVANSLAASGLFLFSVEKADDTLDWQLLESMRFAHSKRYIERLMEENSFTALKSLEATIRMDAGKPVIGFLVLAQLNRDIVERLD